MKSSKPLIGILCLAVILMFIAIIAIPASNAVFSDLTSTHPILMGFAKFALLATAGEIIALRMRSKIWQFPTMVLARFIIWGLLGAWITFMMRTFSVGVDSLIASGFLPCFDGGLIAKTVRAFYISVIMNTTFGPTFMALHKISDSMIDLKCAGKPFSLSAAVEAVSWKGFVSFTILKCVPFFWIPAHTVTFMLPSQYQVMLAAFLSIALGILLNIKKSK